MVKVKVRVWSILVWYPPFVNGKGQGQGMEYFSLIPIFVNENGQGQGMQYFSLVPTMCQWTRTRSGYGVF